MRVLITCPRLYLGGGGAIYYKVLKSRFSIKVDFFEVGTLKEKESLLEKIGHLYSDVVDFYNANSAAIDALATAAMEKWALENQKTGTIINA